MADPLLSKTWATDDVLTASDMNTYVRDNFVLLRPVSIKASGNFSAVFSASNVVTGTLTFGVTFTAGPIVLMQPRISSNLRVCVNLDAAPSTTQAQWRVFQAQGTNISGTAVVDWVAIGTVA